MTNPNEVTDDEVVAACYHIDGDYYENSGTSKMRMRRALQEFLKSRSATSDAADAARFRYMRQNTGVQRYGSNSKPCLSLPVVNSKADLMRGSVAQHLDEAIDAAIAAGGSQ